MKKRRGIYTLLAMILCLSMVLAACGGKGESSGGSGAQNGNNSASGNGDGSANQVTIEVLNISQYADTPEYKAFVERFEAKYPNIKVETISVPHEQYINKRNIMLASGEKVDLIWGNGIYQYDAINKGFLMPIEEIAQEIGVDMTVDFGSSFKPEDDGHYYYFPIQQNNWMLYYNKKVFDDSRVPYPDPYEPLTWDEVADIAEKLTQTVDGKKVYGYFYNHWGMYYYGYGSQLTDGKFYTDDLLSNIDAPEFKRSMEWLYDVMNNRGAAMPISQYISNNTDFLSYWNGGYGMVVGAQWYTQLAATKKEEFPRDWKFGIAPMPVPEELKGKHMNWSSIDSLAVPKNSAHAKEALLFAKEYVSDYTLSTGALPMYNKIDAAKYYEDIAEQLKDDDITLDQIVYLFGGDPDVINVAEKPVLAAPQEYESIFLDQVVIYYTGENNLDDTLSTIKQKVDKAIQEQKDQ